MTLVRVALVALLLAWPTPGSAHAQLQSADPAAGAVLAAPPAAVVLRFNEPVGLLQSRWVMPDGHTLDVAGRADGPMVVVEAPAGLADGTHALSWRVVSDDGHPVGGTHHFSIGAPSASPGPAAAAPPWPAAVARGLLTLCLAFGLGGVLWAVLTGRAVSRGSVALSLGCVPGAMLLLAAQAMDLAGAGSEVLGRGAAWTAALRSPYGATAVLAAAAGLLAALGRRSPLAAVGAVGLGALSFAVAGHAARAQPLPLMGGLVLLHSAAMLFWAGALPGLLAGLGGASATAEMRRFSRLALPVVLVMLLAGGVLAVRQVETPAALTATAYGRVLLAKLALVGALLLLALRHRFVLLPRLADDAATVRPSFARSLKVEIAVMAALLVLTAGFRLTPPPRALTAPPASRVELHLHGRHAMADLALMPGRAGPNIIEISPLDSGFAPLRPVAVTLRLSRPADGIEPVEITAMATSEGRWKAGPVHLPPGGAWDVVVDILITDFRKELLGGTITLQQ